MVVGLDHDDTARILKGGNRPIHKFEARLFVLEHILDVDYIFQIPSIKGIDDISGFYTDIYRQLSPYAIATGLNAGPNGKYKKKQAKLLGIKFIDIPELYNRNTTTMLSECWSDSSINKTSVLRKSNSIF